MNGPSRASAFNPYCYVPPRRLSENDVSSIMQSAKDGISFPFLPDKQYSHDKPDKNKDAISASSQYKTKTASPIESTLFTNPQQKNSYGSQPLSEECIKIVVQETSDHHDMIDKKIDKLKPYLTFKNVAFSGMLAMITAGILISIMVFAVGATFGLAIILGILFAPAFIIGGTYGLVLSIYHSRIAKKIIKNIEVNLHILRECRPEPGNQEQTDILNYRRQNKILNHIIDTIKFDLAFFRKKENRVIFKSYIINLKNAFAQVS